MSGKKINTVERLYDDGVELERFARGGLRVFGQAVELRKLVLSQRVWLAQVQPGTLQRYSRLRKGLKNIPRLAGKPDEIDPFLIRRDGQPEGIATLIFNKTLEHPEKGTVVGTDLDYWLKIDHKDVRSLHETVAGLLISASIQSGERSVFATVLPDHPSPAIGFEGLLHRMGRPAVLSTPEAGDPYGITKGGVALHLFALNQPLTR